MSLKDSNTLYTIAAIVVIAGGAVLGAGLLLRSSTSQQSNLDRMEWEDRRVRDDPFYPDLGREHFQRLYPQGTVRCNNVGQCMGFVQGLAPIPFLCEPNRTCSYRQTSNELHGTYSVDF